MLLLNNFKDRKNANSVTDTLLQAAVDKFNRFWQLKANINMLRLDVDTNREASLIRTSTKRY